MRTSFRASIVAALLCAGAGHAYAQSSPGLTFGQVPTAGQWNSYFAGKQDVLGYRPVNSAGDIMTGRLVTAPPSPTTAGLNMTPGSAPASPVNGDMWVTAAGMFYRANGVTFGPLVGAGAGTFAATSPITVTFPSGVVTYAFDFTVSNTFLAAQTSQGATTTQPGWYAQIAGDTNARVRLGLNGTDVPSLAFGPGNAVRDAFIERVGAGSFRLGAPDAAAPVAQVLGVQNVVAGTSNTAGVNLTINGSQGTGTGAGGSIIFQVAPAGLTGSAQNSLAPALTINSAKFAAFAGGVSASNLALGGATLGANTLAVTGAAAISGTLTSAAHTVTSASASALAAGLNGATNPAFVVDASTASQAAGLKITGAATGGTVALAVIDSGSNANLTINAKGTGTIGIGSVSTGAVTITPAVTHSGATTLSGALTYGGVTLNNAVTGTGNMVLSSAASLTTPTIAGGALSGTFSGTPTLSGSNFVTLANLVQSTAGAQFLGVVGASAGNYAPFTLASLTNLASPSATLDLIPIVDHTTGTIKNVTPGAIASSVVAGVSTFNTLTGNVTTNTVIQTFCPSGCTTTIAGGSSGTYTPTPGMLHAKLFCSAGGGGSAGVQGVSVGTISGGAGGAGSPAWKNVSAATVGASKTVFIGAGGTAGSAGNNAGGNGGDSCITSTSCSSGQIVAGKGGSGGGASVAGAPGAAGAGGVAGTGDIAPPGAAGGIGSGANVSGTYGTSAPGANSLLGAGGISTQTAGAAVAGNPGLGYSSGASGATSNGTTSTAAGAAGAPGYCFAVEEINK